MMYRRESKILALIKSKINLRSTLIYPLLILVWYRLIQGGLMNWSFIMRHTENMEKIYSIRDNRFHKRISDTNGNIVSFWILLLGRKEKWLKVFNNGPSKICGGQPLKNLKCYGLSKADHTHSNFLKAIFYKFYLVHSWILCPKNWWRPQSRWLMQK